MVEVKVVKDLKENVTQEIIRVKDGDGPRFTINSYRTTSRIMVNGPQYQCFIDVILPVIFNGIDDLSRKIQTANEQYVIYLKSLGVPQRVTLPEQPSEAHQIESVKEQTETERTKHATSSKSSSADATGGLPSSPVVVKKPPHRQRKKTAKLSAEEDEANKESDDAPCVQCHLQVKKVGVFCPQCDAWWHYKCANTNAGEIKKLGDDPFHCPLHEKTDETLTNDLSINEDLDISGGDGEPLTRSQQNEWMVVVDALKIQVSDLKAQIASEKQMYKEKNNQYVELKQALSKTNKENSSDITKLKQQNKKLSEENISLKNKSKKLSQQESVHESRVVTLKKTIENQKSTIVSLETKNKELENKNKKLADDNHECEGITTLRKSLEESQTMYQSVVSKLAKVERSEKSKHEKIVYMEKEQTLLKADLEKITAEKNVVVQENEHHLQIAREVFAVEDGKSDEGDIINNHGREEDQQKGLKEKIKEKDKEIKNLKQRISVLEPMAHEKEKEIEELRKKVLAANSEVQREREINNVLLDDRKQQREDGRTILQHSTPISGSRCKNTTKPTTKSSDPLIIYDEEQGDEDGTQNKQEMSTMIDIDTYHASKLEDSFSGDRRSCADSCNKNHMDHESLKGICLFEFARKGSCKRKDECWFSHDIPEEARNNPTIVEKLSHSLEKIQVFRENQNKKKLPIILNKTTEKTNLNIESEIEDFLGQIRQKLVTQVSKSISNVGKTRTV